MRRKIEWNEYAGEMIQALNAGALLTVKSGDKVNTMTIGWATLGREWGKPICTVYVRESRYTKKLLDENPEFVVSFPYGSYDKNILKVCGTVSGRDVDKIAQLGLITREPEVVSVPGIQQLPLTLECKVIYKQKQDIAALDKESLSYYPKTEKFPQGDIHTVYYGEVVAAYILE